MSKINKITVRYSKTTPMRRYESFEVSAFAEVEIELKDNAEDVFKKTYHLLHDEVEKQVERRVKNFLEEIEKEKEKNPA
jgi:hypothetical protein